MLYFAPPFPNLRSPHVLVGLDLGGVSMAISRGMIQVAAPHAYRARILSILQFANVAGGPPGALIYGFLRKPSASLNTLLFVPVAVTIAVAQLPHLHAAMGFPPRRSSPPSQRQRRAMTATDRHIEIQGPGAIILTGPSSCGKGEVAKALCEMLEIPPDHWLSMGGILRSVFEKARDDAGFVAALEARHAITDRRPIFETPDITDALRTKIESHQAGLDPDARRTHRCPRAPRRLAIRDGA